MSFQNARGQFNCSVEWINLKHLVDFGVTKCGAGIPMGNQCVLLILRPIKRQAQLERYWPLIIRIVFTLCVDVS